MEATSTTTNLESESACLQNILKKCLCVITVVSQDFSKNSSLVVLCKLLQWPREAHAWSAPRQPSQKNDRLVCIYLYQRIYLLTALWHVDSVFLLWQIGLSLLHLQVDISPSHTEIKVWHNTSELPTPTLHSLVPLLLKCKHKAQEIVLLDLDGCGEVEKAFPNC